MKKDIISIEDIVIDDILKEKDFYEENRIQLEVPNYYDYYIIEETKNLNKSNEEPRRVIEIKL